MNRDLDLSIVTKLVERLIGELRAKRLWPVAVLLLVGIVAVPFVLAKSSSPAPLPQGPVATPPPAAATSLPTISEQSGPARARLRGHARDPFAQQSGGTATTAATATTTPARTSTTGSTVSPGQSSSTGGTAPAVVLPVGRSTPPPSITNGAKPKPAPSGLGATQSYDVALSITNASGGLDTIDPLARLSVLPSAQSPMLVELGVLQGGRSVLFAVQPGTVVNGPGQCTPGPIDCEIVSVAPGQTEGMSRLGAAGVIQGPLFAVTAITATRLPSAQAANSARRQEVAAGRSLIDRSPLTALSMFQYQPSLGAVVDLRNLAVGGS